MAPCASTSSTSGVPWTLQLVDDVLVSVTEAMRLPMAPPQPITLACSWVAAQTGIGFGVGLGVGFGVGLGVGVAAADGPADGAGLGVVTTAVGKSVGAAADGPVVATDAGVTWHPTMLTAMTNPSSTRRIYTPARRAARTVRSPQHAARRAEAPERRPGGVCRAGRPATRHDIGVQPGLTATTFAFHGTPTFGSSQRSSP